MALLDPKAFSGAKMYVSDWLSKAKEQERIRKNTKLYNRALQAKARFKEASKILKQQKAIEGKSEFSIKLAERKLKRLSTASATLAQKTVEVAKLIQITADQPNEVLQQIKDIEKVHPVASLAELQSTRLGKIGDNKDCQALVIQTSEGLKVLAQIFRYHVEIPVSENGKFDPREYPYDLENMREYIPQPRTEHETHSCYYTVGSEWFGSGPALISALDDIDSPHLSELTISPTDSKAPQYNDRYGLSELLNNPNISNAEIRQRFFDLIYEGKNDVAKFHLNNGASVGWIHINRDADVHKIVVNYVYDREALARNKEFLKGGMVATSEELCEELGKKYSGKVRNLGTKRAFQSPEPVCV